MENTDKIDDIHIDKCIVCGIDIQASGLITVSIFDKFCLLCLTKELNQMLKLSGSEPLKYTN